MTPCFPFCTLNSCKGLYSERKEGSKFFPLRVDPFQKGDEFFFDKVASPESYQFHFMCNIIIITVFDLISTRCTYVFQNYRKNLW